MKVCNVPSCPELHDGPGGRCRTHRRQARQARTDNRVYTSRGHRAFRTAVLTRDPICTLCQTALSTVADHHPRDRRTLVDLNLNPNDPQYGRGLCKPCHDKWTATSSPGGWAAHMFDE